jgi:alpha-beta hydrolase superfamily lysophospholipase
MTEVPPPEILVQYASDGYPIEAAFWPARGTMKGRVVVLHGVQSHYGWYGRLGEFLSSAGYEVHMPDRRGSGHNTRDRGDTPRMGRLIEDIVEYLTELRKRTPAVPIVLGGISWGGKLAIVGTGRRPDLVDALVLLCPGLTPRVGVTLGERFQIFFSYLFNPLRTFLIPLANPALFTANPDAQAYIAADPLSLRAGTARLMGASTILDIGVRRRVPQLAGPVLLMLAGQDRIVDNARTLALMQRARKARLARIEYPEAHHTLEFEPDPTRHARDLVAWLDQTLPASHELMKETA